MLRGSPTVFCLTLTGMDGDFDPFLGQAGRIYGQRLGTGLPGNERLLIGCPQPDVTSS